MYKLTHLEPGEKVTFFPHSTGHSVTKSPIIKLRNEFGGVVYLSEYNGRILAHTPEGCVVPGLSPEEVVAAAQAFNLGGRLLREEVRSRQTEAPGAIPLSDWYFPKPGLFGIRDTPETRQGMQQLDEMITSFVAGFAGWEQMYHRKEGNQLESAEDYEVRLQKLVSWLYARLSPRMQAVLLKEPWPAPPKVEMQPWAPTEEVEVKLGGVVEAPKSPIVGVDWGTEETEGMRKRRAAFSPPGEELPDPLDPVLYNSEITGADTGMDEQAEAGAAAIEPEPRVDVRETLGSLPLAAAGMFEPSTTWRDVIKTMEEHDANLAAVCARSFLREASTFTWEVVSSWAASQTAYDRFQERTGLRPTHVLVAGLRLLRAVQDWRNDGRTNPVEIPLDRRLTLALNDPPGRRELVDRPPTTDGVFLAYQRADGVFLTALDKPTATPEQ